MGKSLKKWTTSYLGTTLNCEGASWFHRQRAFIDMKYTIPTKTFCSMPVNKLLLTSIITIRNLQLRDPSNHRLPPRIILTK